MSTHTAFILAAYGLTVLVVGGLVWSIVREHGALQRALLKFPPRDAGSGDEP